MLASTHAKTAGGKNVKCAVDTFGADPLPEKIKACYCVPPLPELPKVLNPPDDARYASSMAGSPDATSPVRRTPWTPALSWTLPVS